MHSSGLWGWLFRQADLLAQSCHTRIATQDREFRFKADQRAARAEQRMDRADRQIQAIRKLVQTGIKLVIQIAAAQKKTETLVAAHEERLARTEANIERMLAALIRQRPNGRR